MEKKWIAMVLLMLAGFTTVNACSCVPRGTTEQEVAKSDFVAKARLVGLDTVSAVHATRIKRGLAFWKPAWEYSSQPMARAKFVIDRVFKGNGASSDTIYVLTNTSSAACGYLFSMQNFGGNTSPGEYLLFASNPGDYLAGVMESAGEKPRRRNLDRNGYYTTGLCMATQPATAAKEAKLAGLDVSSMGKKQ